MASEIWRTNTDELLGLFRRSLIALVPIADEARMPWRDDEAYDDWDAIVSTLWEQLVLRSLGWAGLDLEPGVEFSPYGLFVDDYSKHHLIRVEGEAATKEGLKAPVFVCLLTTNDPFDTVCCRAVDASGAKAVGEAMTIPFRSSTFRVERRTANGLERVPRDLDVVL